MTRPTPTLTCYLAEWYGAEAIAQPIDATVARLDTGVVALRAEGAFVRLLVALTARTDQVLYSVFAATSPDAVRRACERAGFPAERVTADVEARVMPNDFHQDPFPPEGGAR
ncbi:hypothetical protein [Mycolicibacterium sp. 120270]|uniref:hypothetical protein n=1 Tax=Mycolicibacterium sp. 120270 TaxID=3090600 RepID=UPI00299DDAA1|nr:hypothetical protein [Mycolicibacterium sp. 120270]MDX1881936.1 hypothetical protein [Mycolicibacterium sp. 120270]